jgi:polyphosphate kinase
VLGRFLEHSRIVAFEGGGAPEFWIGSADLMHRNLDRRVEVLVRLARPEHHTELGELFDLAFEDGVSSWRLEPDGTWVGVHTSADGEPLADLQQILIERKQRRKA